MMNEAMLQRLIRTEEQLKILEVDMSQVMATHNTTFEALTRIEAQLEFLKGRDSQHQRLIMLIGGIITLIQFVLAGYLS